MADDSVRQWMVPEALREILKVYTHGEESCSAKGDSTYKLVGGSGRMLPREFLNLGSQKCQFQHFLQTISAN